MIARVALALALAATGPGYEAFTKQELYEGAARWEAKHATALAALEGCEQKLRTRTSTTIVKLALGAPELQTVAAAAARADDPGGLSRFEVGVLAGGVALVVGVLLGVLVAQGRSSAPVVVR